jgi:hypothetical protein
MADFIMSQRDVELRKNIPHLEEFKIKIILLHLDTYTFRTEINTLKSLENLTKEYLFSIVRIN